MLRALAMLAVSAAVYAAAMAWAAARLPEDGVALHVNTHGVVNSYGSRADALALFATLGLVLVGLAVVSIASVRWLPARMINVPNREYWADPSRLPGFRRMLSWDLAVLFSVPLLAFSYLPVDITLTTLDPVGHGQLWLLLAIGLMVLGMVSYVVWMVVRRDRPDDTGAGR